MDRTIRILHLEDDVQDAELVRSILLSAGMDCDFTHVQTPKDFCRAIEKRTYDLILSDHTLPGYDGLSALKTARERVPDIPFVFVSGTIGEEAAINSLLKGASDYVLKNNMKRLVPAVRRTLELTEQIKTRRRAEDALEEGKEHVRRAKNMDSLEMLAGRVAHELNGLLIAIAGFAEMGRKDMDPAAPPARDMNNILNVAERALLLIQHLLAFGQKQVSIPKVIDVNGIILSMKERLRRFFHESILIETALAPVLGRVFADPGQLEQVIMNLAANARDAMPRGGAFLH